MKGFKKMRGKGLFKWPITHSSTGTNMLLHLISASVPVPIRVVPIPLYKNFQNSLRFGFQCTLTSYTALKPPPNGLMLAQLYTTLPRHLHTYFGVILTQSDQES